MAKLFIEKIDVASRTAWFYALMIKAPVEIYEFNPDNEELETENQLKIAPFFMDGNVKLWGSQACILYMAEKYTKSKGLGKTLAENAKIESILAWASTTLYRTVATDFVAPQLYDEDALPGKNKKIQLDSATKSLREQLDVLEKSYLNGQKFILGDDGTFIDFYVVMILTLLDKVNMDLSKWTNTLIWYTSMKEKVSQCIEKFQEH